MEQPENLKKLFLRYLQEEYSAEDVDRLLDYFGEVGSEEELRELIDRALEEEINLTALDSKIKKVDEASFQTLQAYTRPIYRLKNWSFLRVAASILLFVSASWAIYQYAFKSNDEIASPNTEYVEAQNIEPGTDQAILSLANGKDYVLDGTGEGIINDGSSVRYQDGNLLTKIDTPVQVSLRTPLAGQYRTTLPDGTKVWLNAGSEIRYPSAFVSKQREVWVNGEVYFEVAKDPAKPFVVKTDGQRLEVLGTHFNLNAYGDDGAIWTTLSEGGVRVVQQSTGKEVILQPGQQAQNVVSGNMRVREVDIDQVIAWKEGMYILKNQEIGVFGKQIARWYDVEVDMGSFAQQKLSAIIPRNAKLSEVLEAITLETGIHFKVEERRVRAVQK